MFGATDLVKNSDKEKYVHNGYGIAFDGKGKWSFGNDLAKNVIVFGVDKKWIFNFRWRSKFLVLMKDLVHQKKKLILILLKQKHNFVWVCVIIVTMLFISKRKRNI